jgi:tRNA pseudouridine55 synthase
MDGIINLDKPAGISSARAVDQVKRLLPRKTKVGHAGTLDPFATGVLVLLVGKATKYCERLMDQPKQYEATVKLGATTATGDPESPEEPFRGLGVSPESLPPLGRDAQATREQIDAILPRLVGAIRQRPPAFSAMKIAGRRAYDLARGGQAVELEARTVRVYSIELLDYAWPLLTLRIDCGRGTYIRSIARDLGEALGVGGYLTRLRRTRVGDFTIDRAVTPDVLAASTDGVEKHLLPLPDQTPAR